MIYSVIGDCGSGKTLLMTYLAYKDFLEDRDIYSNYKLNFPFKQLTNKFFRDYASFPVFTATVLFDELSLYFSARRSSSKQNLTLKDFIVQTRKRELKLIYSCQQLRLVDINIRENTDGFYEPSILVKRGMYPMIRKPENWVHKPGDLYALKYNFYDKFGKMKSSKNIFPINNFFQLYDTYQILSFNEKEKEKEKGVDKCNK